jgi:hypothetical protein
MLMAQLEKLAPIARKNVCTLLNGIRLHSFPNLNIPYVHSGKDGRVFQKYAYFPALRLWPLGQNLYSQSVGR